MGKRDMYKKMAEKEGKSSGKYKSKEELGKMSELDVSKYSNKLREKRNKAKGEAKKELQTQIDLTDTFRSFGEKKEGVDKKEDGSSKLPLMKNTRLDYESVKDRMWTFLVDFSDNDKVIYAEIGKISSIKDFYGDFKYKATNMNISIPEYVFNRTGRKLKKIKGVEYIDY